MLAILMAATAVQQPRAEIAPLPPLVSTRLLLIPLGGAALLLIGIVWNRLWLLDFLHVTAGGLWTALDLITGFLIGPILRRMEPPARAAFMSRFMPRMLVIMPTLTTITMTAGFQLARKLGVLESGYPEHWWLVASFVIVGVMAVTAFGVLVPANVGVLLELRSPQPNGRRIGRLMSRYAYCTAVLGLMQLGTLIVMTRLATI